MQKVCVSTYGVEDICEAFSLAIKLLLFKQDYPNSKLFVILDPKKERFFNNYMHLHCGADSYVELKRYADIIRFIEENKITKLLYRNDLLLGS